MIIGRLVIKGELGGDALTGGCQECGCPDNPYGSTIMTDEKGWYHTPCWSAYWDRRSYFEELANEGR